MRTEYIFVSYKGAKTLKQRKLCKFISTPAKTHDGVKFLILFILIPYLEKSKRVVEPQYGRCTAVVYFCDNSHKSYYCSECSSFVHPEKRLDCGEPEISQQECKNKGCCWDSSTKNTTWCFQREGRILIPILNKNGF